MGVLLGNRRYQGGSNDQRALHGILDAHADIRDRVYREFNPDRTLETVNDELSEKIPEGKIPEEIQLELLAPWYSENKRDSRTLDLFDAIPKYPFAVTTTIPKLERLEVPFTLRGQRYTALVAPARITDARTKEERLMFPGSREELASSSVVMGFLVSRSHPLTARER